MLFRLYKVYNKTEKAQPVFTPLNFSVMYGIVALWCLVGGVQPRAAIPERFSAAGLDEQIVFTLDPASPVVANLSFCCAFTDKIGNVFVYDTGSRDGKWFVEPQIPFSESVFEALLSSGFEIGDETAQFLVAGERRSGFKEAKKKVEANFLVFAQRCESAGGVCKALPQNWTRSFIWVLFLVMAVVGVILLRCFVNPKNWTFWIVDSELRCIIGPELASNSKFDRALLTKLVEATVRYKTPQVMTLKMKRCKESVIFQRYVAKPLSSKYVFLTTVPAEYNVRLSDSIEFSANTQFKICEEKTEPQTMLDRSPYKYTIVIEDPMKSLIDVKEGILEEENLDNAQCLTYLKRVDDTKYEITFCPAHSVLLPFLAQGHLLTVVLSLFDGIIKILERNPYLEMNYRSSIEIMVAALDVRRALVCSFEDGESKLIWEKHNTELEDIGITPDIEQAARQISAGYKYFDGILPDCERMVIARLVTKDDIFVVFGVNDKDHGRYFMDQILPVFAMAAVVIYQFSSSYRRCCRFNRLLSIFDTSKMFSFFEVTKTEILNYRSSRSEHANLTLEKLEKLKFEIPEDQQVVLNQKLHDLWEHGIPIVQYTVSHVENGVTRHCSLNLNRIQDQRTGEYVVSIFTEDVTDIKQRELDLLEAHKELQLANDALGLHKVVISTEGDITLVDDKLFEELNLPPTPDRALVPLIVKEDLTKIQSGSHMSFIRINGGRLTQGMRQSVMTMRRGLKLEGTASGKEKNKASSLTLRLIDGKGGYAWYSMVSDGKTGFIFSVDSTVTMRRQLQTTEKSLKIASVSSGFTFWGVNVPNDRVERLLKYDNIWDALGVDQDTPFTKVVDYVIDGKDEVRKILDEMKAGTLQSWNGDVLFQTTNGQHWFRCAISASSPVHFNCFMMDITEQKEMEAQLYRSQELRDMILSSAQIFLWTFNESDDETEEPLPQAHTIRMNWKFVETEVAEESREEFTEAVKVAFQEHGNIDCVILMGENWYSVRGKFVDEGNRLVGICCDITQLKQAYNDLAREQERAQAANKAKSIFLANMSHEIRTPLNGIIGMLDILAMYELTVEQRLLIDAIRSSSFELMKQLTQTLSMSRIEKGNVIELNNEIFDISKSLEAVAVAAATRAKLANLKLIFSVAPDFPVLIYGEPQVFLQIVNNLMSNALKFTKSGSVSLSVRWEYEPKETLLLDVRDTGIGMSEEQKQVIFNRFSQADASVARFYGGTGLGLALVQDLIAQLGGSITFDSKLGEGTQFHVKLPFLSIAYPCPMPFPEGSPKHAVIVVTDKKDPDEFVNSFIKYYYFDIIMVESSEELEKEMTPKVIGVLVDIERFSGDAVALRNLLQQKYEVVIACSISAPGSAKDFPRSITKPVLPLPLRQLLDDLRYQRCRIQSRVETVKNNDVTCRKILVVEDNRVNQFVMSKMLTKLNMEFKIADNGAIALDVLDQDKFDLVFMDCQMPVMDGLEATRRIRSSDKGYQNVPIVALTASAIEGDEELCRSVGMDGYLAKPVRIQQIMDAIKKFTAPNT